MRFCVSRNATSSSPSSLTRTGGQSGEGSSQASSAGIQYRRMVSPIGVPRSTRVRSSLSAGESMPRSSSRVRGGKCSTARSATIGRMTVYGSDLVVDLMRAVGIAHVAINPGATYRGLHDSLVNHGRGDPEMILNLHEEIAVALAHGYAKARGAPMAAAVHDIVGLQHASMAIFNAFCDRAPILVLGATGPMDAARRRPWIDWIHTALVQGTQVRDYVKLDDQPASVAAIPEALLRCWRLAVTEPQGPVYLCLDAGLQEEPLASSVALPDVTRFRPAAPPHASPHDLDEAARRLAEARSPVIVVESLGRRPEATRPLCRLAELLAAPLVDLAAESQGRPRDRKS